MPSTFSITAFINELEHALPQSNAAERKRWASTLLENEIVIEDLSRLLECDKKVASRFLWFVSDIGEMNPPTLYDALPFLFELRGTTKHVNLEHSFASWWRIAGVPPAQEALAIDLLFGWLRSSSINITTKSRALFVLHQLSAKYPDLKSELKLSLENQLEGSSASFKKRAMKVIANC